MSDYQRLDHHHRHRHHQDHHPYSDYQHFTEWWTHRACNSLQLLIDRLLCICVVSRLFAEIKLVTVLLFQ